MNSLSITNTYSNQRGVDFFSISLFFTFLASVLLSVVAFDPKYLLVSYFVIFGIYLAVLLLETYYIGQRDFSVYLVIPVIISATQNLYLGLVAPYTAETPIQLLVVTNYLFSIVLAGILFLRTPFRMDQTVYKKALTMLMILVVYSLATMVIFHADIKSGLASLRNMMAPMLFLLIGMLASSNVRLKTFLKYIVWVAGFVLVFGMIERFLFQDIWLPFHLEDLWLKKGLPINEVTGLPHNFYSSELVGGSQLRRMVASFADPVNLGTFLFFGFMAAWFKGKKIMTVLLLLSFGLAVSKGALLGFLVFCVVWSYYKLPKSGFIAVATGAGLSGAGFILYSMTSSTNSMFLHMTGFFSSFKELVYHPLGRGLGNIGVLAGRFGQGAETEITESGLGMVIGQLGIVGLVLYVWFFVFIFKQSSRIQDTSEKILAKSLILGILLNIMFNEVALSPNSSAVYFMAIGLIIGTWHERTKHLPEVRKKRIKIVW